MEVDLVNALMPCLALRILADLHGIAEDLATDGEGPERPALDAVPDLVGDLGIPVDPDDDVELTIPDFRNEFVPRRRHEGREDFPNRDVSMIEEDMTALDVGIECPLECVFRDEVVIGILDCNGRRTEDHAVGLEDLPEHCILDEDLKGRPFARRPLLVAAVDGGPSDLSCRRYVCIRLQVLLEGREPQSLCVSGKVRQTVPVLGLPHDLPFDGRTVGIGVLLVLMMSDTIRMVLVRSERHGYTGGRFG